MKTIILGNSGSGKTTLAKQLAAQTGAAVLCLDDVAFATGAHRLPVSESVQAAVDFINRHPSWVVEGCYADIVRPLLGYCSELIFLNPGVDSCVANCLKRPWEPEKFATPEEQHAGLAALVDWVKRYEQRTDEYGLLQHQAVFDAFTGPKRVLRQLGSYL